MNYELKNKKEPSRTLRARPSRPRLHHNSLFIIPNSSQKGFSLVELFVSIAIFIVIIGAVVINQNKFADNLLTSDVAYDVASAVREAQSYGMNVKNAGPVNAPNYNNGYGLHLSASNLNQNQLTLFNDQFVNAALDAQGNQISGNHTCDNNCDPTSSEYIKSYTLNHNDTIQKFCGLLPGDSWPQAGSTDTRLEECNDSQTNPLTYLDIAFTRPNPDAFIVSNQSPTDPTTHLPLQRYIGARIYVASPSGTQWVEETGNSGQISVKSMPGIGFRPPPSPLVTISASPTTVTIGGSPTTITWSSTRATSCVGTSLNNLGLDTWGPLNLPTSGSISGTTQSSSVTYTVSCSVSGVSGSNSVTVAAQAYTPPPPISCPGSAGFGMYFTSPVGGEVWASGSTYTVAAFSIGNSGIYSGYAQLRQNFGQSLYVGPYLSFVNDHINTSITIPSGVTPGSYSVWIWFNSHSYGAGGCYGTAISNNIQIQ